MKCYLRTKSVKIQALGATLEMREMSAAGQAAIMDALEAKESQLHIAGITAKHCVVPWADEAVDEIISNVSAEALTEISAAAADLSGISYDPKASKKGRAAA